jgi:peptidoglycan/LPS O-acetylase OafA/YrhL
MGAIGFAFGTGPKPRVWDYHLFSPYMLMFAFGWAMCCATELSCRLIVPKMLGISAAIWVGILLLTDPSDYFLIFRMLLTASVFTVFHAMRPILQVNNVVNRTASVIADAPYSLYLSHWFVLSSLGKLFGVLHFSQALDFRCERWRSYSACSLQSPASVTLNCRSAATWPLAGRKTAICPACRKAPPARGSW